MVQTFCLGKNAFETVELYESEKFEFRYLLREISDSSFFVAELQKLLALESKTCRGRHVELQEMMTNNCNISKGAHRLLMYLVLILWPTCGPFKTDKKLQLSWIPKWPGVFRICSTKHRPLSASFLQPAGGGELLSSLETLATRSCGAHLHRLWMCVSLIYLCTYPLVFA